MPIERGRFAVKFYGSALCIVLAAVLCAVAPPPTLAAPASGKSFALDWAAVDGGGGQLVGGRFRVAAGSIGQAAAAKVGAGKLAALESGVPIFATDTDADGIDDTVEEVLGTSPLKADTDADGLSDFAELEPDGDPDTYRPGIDTDPLNEDTDADGLLDGEDPDPLIPAARADVPALPPLAAAALMLALALAIAIGDRRRPRAAK